MSKVTRWNHTVQCPHLFCPSVPKDDDCTGCERCEGRVTVKGYSRPATHEDPSEYENEIGKCDVCGYEPDESELDDDDHTDTYSGPDTLAEARGER